MKCLSAQGCSDFAARCDLDLRDRQLISIEGRNASWLSGWVPGESRQQAVLVNRLFDQFPSGAEWLLWITEWGVWPTEESQEVWRTIRERFQETRPLKEAPGHLLGADERGLALGMTRLALLFGWDATLITRPLSIVTFFSHDETIDFAAPAEQIDALTRSLEDLPKWRDD